MLIVLDLDETLMHSSSEWLGRRHDFIAANTPVFVRPFATELIADLLSRCRVAVWTASYGQYTSELIEYFFGGSERLEFVWDRHQCVLKTHSNGSDYFAKDLTELHKAGWAEGEFCLIDDRPEHIIGKLQNVISVKPYYGSIHDRELSHVMDRINQSQHEHSRTG